jgi:hypothetical protein
MRRRGAILFVLLAWASFVPAGQAQQAVPDMTVIVHPSVSVQSLDRSSLAAIFSMSRRSWENGVTVVPFNYPPESPMRQAFDVLVLGLQPAEVSRYWIDQRIRGQGHPPRQVADPALVLRLVANVKGSIGYLPAGMEDKTVKVVARISKGKIVAP